MNKRKIIVFLGPPGSGKGSLSRLCEHRFKWVQLSTGNLCRRHIAERTDIGCKIHEAIQAGGLIDDSLVSTMVDEWILGQKQDQSIILDGYPRTLVQAQGFHALMQEKLTNSLVHVIRLALPDEKVVSRLMSRVTCSNKECQTVYSLTPGSPLAPTREMVCDTCASPLSKRTDDEVQAIRERLKTYYKHEQSMLDFYDRAGFSVKSIEVNKPLSDVFVAFEKLMNEESR